MYETTAWALVRTALINEQRQQIAKSNPSDAANMEVRNARACRSRSIYVHTPLCLQVSFTSVRSRRVMLPAFVGEYEQFGSRFRVFINGATGQGYSLQQDVFPAPQFAFLKQLVVEVAFESLVLFPIFPVLSRLLFYPPFLIGSVAAFTAVRLFHRYVAMNWPR